MSNFTGKDNSTQSEKVNENKLQRNKLNTIQNRAKELIFISKVVMCIWLIPGILIIFNSLLGFSSLNTKSISSKYSSITYEQVVHIVDSKTQENYGFINILLFVLTALPLAGNNYFWLLYKSFKQRQIEDYTQGLNKKNNELVDEELKPKNPEYIKNDKLTNELTNFLDIQSEDFYLKAYLYAVVDEKESALNFLKKALDEAKHENEKTNIKEQTKRQPAFDNIKNDDNYKKQFDKLINK